jgi:hypothetical protein
MFEKGKKPGLAVIIGVGKPKGGPPELDAPGRGGSAAGKGFSARNQAQENPEEEKGYHEQGQPPAPTPESVGYHTAAEACGNCEYFKGGNCEFLRMPVNEGDWCRRFEDRQEDVEEQGEPAGESEYAEGEPA